MKIIYNYLKQHFVVFGMDSNGDLLSGFILAFSWHLKLLFGVYFMTITFVYTRWHIDVASLITLVMWLSSLSMIAPIYLTCLENITRIQILGLKCSFCPYYCMTRNPSAIAWFPCRGIYIFVSFLHEILRIRINSRWELVPLK